MQQKKRRFEMGGCGLKYGAACARRTGRGWVSYPQEVEGWSEVSTPFCRLDPLYKLPAATLQRLSHPVSQTGPSVVVGPTVPAQQKKCFAITFERNTFSEIDESKSKKTRCYCRKDTYIQPKRSGGEDI